MPRRTARRAGEAHRRSVVAGAAALGLALSGCGSQVPPQQVLGAQGIAAQPDGNVVTNSFGVPIATNGTGQPGGLPYPVGAGSGSPGGVPGSGRSGGTGLRGERGHGGTPTGGTPTAGTPASDGAAAGIKAGSCTGFTNSTGITDDTITIANIADLSGPVPGLFKSAQAAVTAYVAYFNATASICGRKLKLVSYDSGTSESGDQQAATQACGSAFAAVGSLGAFDAGGAAVTAGCGQPDIRALMTETARQQSPTSFGAYSTVVNEVYAAPYEYLKTVSRDAPQSAAFVYLNAGAAIQNANSFMTALTKLGYDIKDKIAIDVTSVPNYNGYATQLKSDGIKYVEYLGAAPYAVQLKEAFYRADFDPVFVMDPVAYDPAYVGTGSQTEAVNGTYSIVPAPLFEEVNRNPELENYLTWLARTSGGPPVYFGIYAWSAAALFARLAIELGGRLTRASMVAALRGVHSWTDRDMHPPQDPGGKHTGHCASVVQLVNGAWVRRTPYPWTCGRIIET
jgi:ABC-type branched-subunit amino acid transport system substrate-binding protein